jgi:transcriptional regulator with XRE-family HTH domain
MSTQAEHDVAQRELGLRVRALRRSASMTTREVAAKAGVSASLVNQVETGKTSPSFSTLRRIAHALDVPLGEFFSDGGPESAPAQARHVAPSPPPPPPGESVVIVRRDRRKRLQLPDSHVVHELLTPNLRWDVEFLWVELEPGHPPLESMGHPGQESAIVIAGTMHVIVGEDEYVLETGDAISLDSSIPHRIENRGEETVIQISAITPPSF